MSVHEVRMFTRAHNHIMGQLTCIQVLAGLYHMYIDCQVFNTVTYQPALYPVIGVSISCITYLALLENQDKRKELVVLPCLALIRKILYSLLTSIGIYIMVTVVFRVLRTLENDIDT